MKKQYVLQLLVLFFFTTACSEGSLAMGKFKAPSENTDSGSNGSSGSTGGQPTTPVTPPTPPTTPPPTVPTTPPPTAPTNPPPTVPTNPPTTPPTSGDRGPASEQFARPSNFNVISEVAYPIGVRVDQRYKSYRELLVTRDASVGHKVDSCDPELDRNDRFADRIAYMVDKKMQLSTAQVGYVASYFNLPKDQSTYAKNSLISHPLCTVTTSTLETTFGGKNIPSAATITKINTFVNLMNGYRNQALQGNSNGYVNATKLWSKFFMCLSYAESLSTADTSKSNSVASKYAPSGYRKPAGVKFYEDPYQDEASRLNIGLFQFTPTAGGNVQACIREWNQAYPKCTVSQTASQAELIRVFGSSVQTFNAFCGVSKVTGTFGVQINTTGTKNTHPNNLKSNGTLKARADRCVSPHFVSGRAYNHFGPLQNTSGTTLDALMTCTLAE